MNVMGKEKILSVTMPFEVRFSEVDSMGVVWHGNYAIYFEDAREAFGAKYGLQYLMMYDKGFFEPVVELTFKYKHVMVYGMKPEITVIYRPCESAKIIFDYEIRDTETGEVLVTGHSVQVFMDAKTHQLVMTCPDFYEEWKKKWEVNV